MAAVNVLSEAGGLTVRVALIAAPYPLEEFPSPPLGLSYVAAAFEAAGCEVRVFDYIISMYSREKLASQLERFQPDLVGAHSVTMNFFDARAILRDVKSIHPDILTLMGGPHVSFTVEETLRCYPEIDLIFVGEAEDTISDFVKAGLDRAKWRGIQGLAWRDGDEIINPGRRDFIIDIDRIAMPARHLSPISRYRALGYPVSMITGRGCPHACIFCLGRRMVGSKVRRRDPNLVLDEMQQILAMGFNRINIADDLFASDTERVLRICAGIKQRCLTFGWSAFARVDTVTQDMLDAMADAGCDSISFGIESGCPEMLKRVRKGITLEQATHAVDMCKKSGMLPHASFIVGLPGETKETLARTDAFARSLDVLFGYHYLAPFPGTKLRVKNKSYDLEILTDDWSRYDANDAIVQTSSLTPQDLRDFVAIYNAEMHDGWQTTLDNYGTGRNTPRDELRVAGHHRMNITFAMLKEDLVEKLGLIKSDDARKDPNIANTILADRMVADIKGDPDLIRQTVSDFIARGFIRTGPRDDGWGFGWEA